MTTQPVLRRAGPDDLPAINDIFNHYVERSTCAYLTEPVTLGERQAWFADHGQGHPIWVVELAGEVVGWGSLSPFHVRAAYCHTVEDSVYLRPDCLRQGLGRLLLQRLIDSASELGHHTIVALIDSEQEGSIALHVACGFAPVGHLREVGHKFGRWLDVVYLQLVLTA